MAVAVVCGPCTPCCGLAEECDTGKKMYVQCRRHHSTTLTIRRHCVYLTWNFLLSRETSMINLKAAEYIQHDFSRAQNLLLMLLVLYCSTFTARDATLGLHRGSDAVCHKGGMYSVAFLACRVFIMSQLTTFENDLFYIIYI